MPDVQMPRLSDSMETGKIVKWLKQEGEQVKKGEPLVEIESDKANIEVDAYSSGTLSQIVVKEGDSAPIGAVIAKIGGDGESGRGAKEEAAAPPAKAKAAPEEQAEAAEPEQPKKGAAAQREAPAARAGRPEEHVEQADKAVAKTASRQQAEPEAGGGEQYPQGGPDDREEAGPVAAAALQSIRRKPAEEDGERIKASPVARRLADEKGVDLSRIEGTGPGGRITREDVEAAAGKAAPQRPGPAEAPPRAQPRREVARPTEEVEVVELSKMQATVAMRLAESKFSAPHFYVTSEIDMEDAIRFRETFNETVGSDQAISFNDLVLKAVASALTRFPEVNASWAGSKIERKRDINIGIAVNLPDGLIVPVVRNADQKDLVQIGEEARALIERAKARKARPEDYQGNTFTVSNMGMFDVDQFTAIINPPDSGILAVGSIQDKPVVRNGQVVAGKRMRVTLSVDHRVFYGVTAAQFLQEVKRLLEHPMALILGGSARPPER